MPTAFDDFFARLAAPFEPADLRDRTGTGGKKFTYITARAAMNRLDDVAGPENWWDEYEAGEKSVLCRLSVRLPDGRVLTKCDAGGYAGMSDSGDDDKSGYSDAFKRAAVKFGVARYLYRDGVPAFVREIVKGGKAPRNPVEGTPPFDPGSQPHQVIAPDAPGQRAAWVLMECGRQGHYERLKTLAAGIYQTTPEGLDDTQAEHVYGLIAAATAVKEKPLRADERPAPPGQEKSHAPGHNGNGNPVQFGWPTSGAALYRWAKNIEESFRRPLVREIDREFSGDGRPADRRFPRNYKEWTPEQVQEGAHYAARLVRTWPGYTGEWDGKLPGLMDLDELRDAVWARSLEMCEALGNNEPGPDLAWRTIADVAMGLADKHGGEVIGDLRTCTNEALLKDVLEALDSDVADARRKF